MLAVVSEPLSLTWVNKWAEVDRALAMHELWADIESVGHGTVRGEHCRRHKGGGAGWNHTVRGWHDCVRRHRLCVCVDVCVCVCVCVCVNGVKNSQVTNKGLKSNFLLLQAQPR